MHLGDSLSSLQGVGTRRAALLRSLGLTTVESLLHYRPRSYEDRRIQKNVETLPLGVVVCFEAMVVAEFQTRRIRQGLDLSRGRIADEGRMVDVTFFNQNHLAKSLSAGEQYVFCGKLTEERGRRQLLNPIVEPVGELLLTGGLVPQYPLVAGLSQKLLGQLVRRVFAALGELGETLPPSVLQQYGLCARRYALQHIHLPESFETLLVAQRRLVFEELLCLCLGLSLLRAHKAVSGGMPMTGGSLDAFYAHLPFPPTGAQRRVLAQLQGDLARDVPMNRLLQGDVGAGKTAVAAGLCHLVVENGFQCAMMAPTELLARQHLVSLGTLLPGRRLALLHSGVKDKSAVYAAVAAGEVDVLVGTHALLQEPVQFHRLGLVIADEQQRFGVSQRTTLVEKGCDGIRPHVLVMSATPIPRTLALMIYGELDLSVLDELPPGRKPVRTHLLREHKREGLYGFLSEQMQAGRQVYVVCPNIEESEGEASGQRKAAVTVAEELRARFTEQRVGLLHGKLKSAEKEAVMADFLAGDSQLLVSTTVIEVGVDVPRASVMVIENAECFGLSQLHQLRGRVGRGADESYCFLFTASKNAQTMERLRALCESTDGFHIAREDLRLRGPGDFLGARQHGLPQLQMADLATDMGYLDECREAAARLLAEDPTLQQERNRPLRRRVLQLFAEHKDSFH